MFAYLVGMYITMSKRVKKGRYSQDNNGEGNQSDEQQLKLSKELEQRQVTVPRGGSCVKPGSRELPAGPPRKAGLTLPTSGRYLDTHCLSQTRNEDAA